MDTDQKMLSGSLVWRANLCSSRSFYICVHLCSSVVLGFVTPASGALPFSGPGIVAKNFLEEGKVASNFSSHFLDTFTSKAQQSAVRKRAGTGHERGASRDRLAGDILKQTICTSAYRLAEDQDKSKTVESAKPRRTLEQTSGRIEQERVNKQAITAEKDFIAALETAEGPTLAAGGPASAEPVHQHEAAAGMKMKFLPL